MLKNSEVVTDIWRDFEKGRAYNRQKNLYNQTEQNYDYYYGNQAKYLNIGNETPVIENIIKSIVKYKLGVVNSNAYEIVYNPNNTGEQDIALVQELCKVLSHNSNKIWELEQVGKKIKECVKDACINDEGIIHSYFDKDFILLAAGYFEFLPVFIIIYRHFNGFIITIKKNVFTFCVRLQLNFQTN